MSTLRETAVARHRIRRWLQFGVLDLLMLTAAAAMAAALVRPADDRSVTAKPWLFGTWADGKSVIFLSPDGCYSYNLDPHYNLNKTVDGVGWTLARAADVEGVFVLTCGELRLSVRGDPASETLEALAENGSVQSRYQRLMGLEGPFRAGVPHGTWTIKPGLWSLEYRHGEPIDCHDSNGSHDLAFVNGLRSRRSLPPLSRYQLASEDTRSEQEHSR